MTSTDADGATATCVLTVQVTHRLTVGEVQGQTLDTENGATDRSPLAPATGNGSSATLYDVRGVITQRTLARTSSGANQYGFFLQSRLGATDGDPLTSDGIFVFMGSFTTLIGGYAPAVGDEVVLRARVAEFFSLTQLTSASLVRMRRHRCRRQHRGGGHRRGAAGRPGRRRALLGAPRRRPDAGARGQRHDQRPRRLPGTADSEIWLVDVDDPLLDRADPYARRVFRDPHPLDNQPTPLFDDGNGQRIMLGGLGVKAVAGDNTVLLPPGPYLRHADRRRGGRPLLLLREVRRAGRVRVLRRRAPTRRPTPPRQPANRTRSSRSRASTSRTSTTSATTRSTGATSSATRAAPA